MWAQIEEHGPRATGHGCATFATYLTHIDEWNRRDYFAPRYSWAVPSKTAISAIKEFVGTTSIVEINAGRGLWASLLQAEGIEITATDPHTYDNYFTEVVQVDADTAVDKYLKGGALFTCWPNYLSSYATKALKTALDRKGITAVIYIGEDRGGCCAEDGFFDLLENWFDLKEIVKIPQWWGLHDQLYLYRLK